MSESSEKWVCRRYYYCRNRKKRKAAARYSSQRYCCYADCAAAGQKISSVVSDYNNCGYEAVKYLYSKGCRQIGFISGTMELSPYRERYNGYKRALEELGLTETSTLSSIPDNSFEYGFQCTEDLLEQNPNLDAIMAAVDIQGIGAMRALKEHCISIPDQIRLISLTGHFIGSIMPTTMTSMEMPARLMGKRQH